MNVTIIGRIGKHIVLIALAATLAPGAFAHRGEKDMRAPRDSDFPVVSEAMVRLGNLLYFEKALSGNKNISCATCHSPLTGSSDGLSINIGEGGHGLSVARDAGPYPPTPDAPLERGQRNAPGLFNVGAKDFERLMHDGRFAVDPSFPQGFLSPAGADLPFGFDTVLEALSIFPFTEAQEMTGQPGENEIADAQALSQFVGVWNAVLARIKAIPDYHRIFFEAFPELGGNIEQLKIQHVGKAIAAFQVAAFRSDDSPFDRYLRGDEEAMSKSARRGFKIFRKKGRCIACHSGPFLTDHEFHAIGVPQIGPGFGGVGHDGREDFGREGVTENPRDRYRFRTPSLRNVALTGPWGHDGAFNSLEGIVLHHLNAPMSLRAYDPSQRVLPPRPDLDALDLIAFSNPATTAAIEARIEIAPVALSRDEFDDLMSFLHALTDPRALDLRKLVPVRLPSGLPLAD